MGIVQQTFKRWNSSLPLLVAAQRTLHGLLGGPRSTVENRLTRLLTLSKNWVCLFFHQINLCISYKKQPNTEYCLISFSLKINLHFYSFAPSWKSITRLRPAATWTINQSFLIQVLICTLREDIQIKLIIEITNIDIVVSALKREHAIKQNSLKHF